MLRGDSGVGKSECALALIERGHSLVADDLTIIKLLDERELMASSRRSTAATWSAAASGSSTSPRCSA
jgi:serine kinase of HPr protein (carbohydrate metabolism regulator)